MHHITTHMRNIEGAARLDPVEDHDFLYLGDGQYARISHLPAAQSVVADTPLSTFGSEQDAPAENGTETDSWFRLNYRQYVSVLNERIKLGEAVSRDDMVLGAIFWNVRQLSAGKKLSPKAQLSDLVNEAWAFVHHHRGAKGDLPTLIERFDPARGSGDIRKYLMVPLRRFLVRKSFELFDPAGRAYNKILDRNGDGSAVYAKIGAFDEDHGPDSYEYEDLSNEEADELPFDAAYDDDELDTPEEDASDKLTQLFGDLTPEDCEVLISYRGLFGKRKLTLAQISAATGVAQSTIWDRVVRAETRLKDMAWLHSKEHARKSRKPRATSSHLGVRTRAHKVR